MKTSIKIALPLYKLCCSALFLIGFPLVTGISFDNEIGILMERYVPLISMVLFSNIYISEVNRETFQILLQNHRELEILKRILVLMFFSLVFTCCEYWFFYYLDTPACLVDSKILLFFYSVLASFISTVFFGMIAFTMVNLLGNLWTGFGATLILWSILITQSITKIIPNYLYPFSFSEADNVMDIWDWFPGKIFCTLIIVLLVPLNLKLLIKGNFKEVQKHDN